MKTPMCGEPGGKTSPEELAAAAHSACFSMALALRLAEHGHDSERLTVAATVTLDEVDGAPTVVSSELEVRARAPGLDRDWFDAAVEEAAQLCPISRLFAGAQITVQANLEQNWRGGRARALFRVPKWGRARLEATIASALAGAAPGASLGA